MWRRIMRFHYLETLFWLLSLIFLAYGADDYNENAVPLCGICVLAAIGIRATKPIRGASDEPKS